MSRKSDNKTRVALIGGGTVGSAVVGQLRSVPSAELIGVLVRDPSLPRTFSDHARLVTTDPGFLHDADIVIEVAGGTGAAADLALAALARGQSVVTANKAALAERWSEYAPYLSAGRLYLESAVMAGVPVIGAVACGLRGAGAVSAHAVLNGTCNVILAGMEAGQEYSTALKEAQDLGFAEADPALDVGGIDSAHKLSILLRLGFDPDASWDRVAGSVRGITELSKEAVAAEVRAGRAVRLVGSITWDGDAGWSATVRPVSLPRSHPLVATGPTNALLFRGSAVAEVLLKGPGAGGGSTAGGVMADVLAALAGRPGPAPLTQPVAAPGSGATARPEEGDEFLELV